MKNLLILSISLVGLLSCGPNAEQKAAMQKQHDDSVARVAALNAQQAQQQADAAAAQAKEERNAAMQTLRVYQQQLEGFVADMNALDPRRGKRIRFAQFLAADAERAGLDLPPGDRARFMRFRVRAQRDSLRRGECRHLAQV